MPIGIMDKIGNAVTSLTRPDNVSPIIAQETLCISGRTRMAYKRGGEQEARERVIEEVSGTITWLGGVKFLNYVGDKILGYVLKNKGVAFDVGSDIMRRPFDNFMMNKGNYPAGFSPDKISILKGVKVISAIVLANLFIGFAVPKLNQALSRKINKKKAEKQELFQNLQPEQPAANTVKKDTAPAFKGLAGLNTFTNFIENTNVGKLLATDIGIAGGRGLNARRKEETLDILVRDLGSIYFYYWARDDAAKVMNLIETGGKTSQRLDPKSVNRVTKYLEEYLAANGGSMSVEDFRKSMFGTGTKEIPLLNFEKEITSKFSDFMAKLGRKPAPPIEVIELDKFLAALTPAEKEQYDDVARKMSELQPKRCGVSIISKNQIADVLKGGEANSPKLLHVMFDNYTDGAYKSEYRYISHKDLYKYKDRVVKYIEELANTSKNGRIDSALLKAVKNKNLAWTGLNFIVGFSICVAFISTIIPKLQYYITKKVTGKSGFPGDDNFLSQPKDNVSKTAA